MLCKVVLYNWKFAESGDEILMCDSSVQITEQQLHAMVYMC